MENKWAYLGEADVDTFKELTSAFPEIVGIGVDTENDIILGVNTELGDKAIGMYQLIVGLWGNKELIQKVWDLLM